MKLSAAAGRGSKKDFFDIYELLQHFSFQDLLSSYQQKYTQVDPYHVIRSLSYFDDAELQQDPIMLKDYTWNMVKSRLQQEIQLYVDTFF
jgi:hypothetical protein